MCAGHKTISTGIICDIKTTLGQLWRVSTVLYQKTLCSSCCFLNPPDAFFLWFNQNCCRWQLGRSLSICSLIMSLVFWNGQGLTHLAKITQANSKPQVCETTHTRAHTHSVAYTHTHTHSQTPQIGLCLPASLLNRSFFLSFT